MPNPATVNAQIAEIQARFPEGWRDDQAQATSWRNLGDKGNWYSLKKYDKNCPVSSPVERRKEEDVLSARARENKLPGA
jgi:hypothetical protein